jgi:O-antigen ligase
MIEDRISQARKFILFSLPYLLIFSIKVSNLFIILFAVTTIAGLFFGEKSKYNKNDMLLGSTLFLVSAAGLLYTDFVKIGLSLLETRIPLVLFPVLFAVRLPDLTTRVRFIRHFLYSLSLTFVVTLSIALYRNIYDTFPDVWFSRWYFHYSDLTAPINIDPLYLALFVCFGITIILMELLDLTQYGFLKSKTRATIMLIVFAIFISILGVRSILLILVLLLIVIFFLSRKFSPTRAIILGVFLALIIGISFASPVTRERFEGLFTSKFEFSEYSVDRFIIWTVAFDYIKKHPYEFIIGHGTGSSEKLMEEQYKVKGINWDFEKKSNTHNQYLGFLLDVGIVGSMMIFGFLITSLVIFYKSNDKLGLIFIILISLAMVSENYLNRQKGVVFFSVFYSLLYFSRHAVNKNTEELKL